MTNRTLFCFALLVNALTSLAASSPSFAQQPDPLAAGFAVPPEATRPRCYWYWMDGNVTKEGITKDLESMKKVGVGEAYIGIIAAQAGPLENGAKAFTDPWWGLIEHAIREGGRLGVDIGMFNGPGWSQSGGPWVKPEQAMRHVVSSEIRLYGPQHFEGALPTPPGSVSEVATIAYPAPMNDTDNISKHNPKISGDARNARLFDGDPSTSAPAPAGDNGPLTLEVAQPFTARSLVVYPSRGMMLGGELQVSDDGQNFHKVRNFTVDRHDTYIGFGPVPLAPVSYSFPAVTGKFFRFTFSGGDELGEIEVSGAPRVEQYQEKQLNKAYQGSQPPFEAQTWPTQPEPEDAALMIAPGAVQNITSKVVDGKLTWDVPAGDWIVMRSGMAWNGLHNGPTPPEATGLEVDKMNRDALKVHFDSYMGELLGRMPAADRTALKHVVADSYEVGTQNWTDGLAADFKTRYGYDPIVYLPVLTGRVVGSQEQSDRFLWDVRRLVADRVATEYVGGLRDLSHQHGLKVWLENYGHYGFPGEFLQYGGQSDEIGGEFWASGINSAWPLSNLGNVELRNASSASHIYGKPVTYAEAWTTVGPPFTGTPWMLKLRGDWAFCQGINQFVFHVNVAQPDDRKPGITALFGTEFNRKNTWFPESKSWIDYLRRCHFMLQQGKYVADVAYFITEDTPKMTGLQDPALPAGYSFDYINADVINNRLKVKNGRFVLPDGMSYRILVLPKSAAMRPELLKKVSELVAQGGNIMGEPPSKSPSLQNFPASDAQVQKLAADLWANCDGTTTKSAVFGKGHVFRNIGLDEALKQLDTVPELSGFDPNKINFIHRRTGDADIYFLSNQSLQEQKFTPSFRVTSGAPEIWNADTGDHRALAVYQKVGNTIRIPMKLMPRESTFVVFRGKANASPVLKVLRDGKPILDTSSTSANKSATPAHTFSYTLWVKPKAETSLFDERTGGVIGLAEARNDVIFPPQGEIDFGPGHAGSGLAVGTNGVMIFQHSANYFAPILAYRAPISGWTHIGVVYKDDQPSLYVNGALVHTGLKSTYVVHPALPNATFQGIASSYEQFPMELSADDITKRMQATTPTSTTGDAAGAPFEVNVGAKNEIQVIASQAGNYELQRGTRPALKVTVPKLLFSTELDGPWQVAFPAGSGAPAQTTFNELGSLTENADPTIKYFSGSVTYSKDFNIAADAVKPTRRLTLDLGNIGDLAQISVNGKVLGTLWQAPYTIDISKFAKPGTNHLEIKVSNTWHNRLVGQKQNPEAFNKPGVEQLWASVMPGYGPNETLYPAGLIGPVTLRQAAIITVR